MVWEVTALEFLLNVTWALRVTGGRIKVGFMVGIERAQGLGFKTLPVRRL
jgi:hypothetical protein